MEMAGFQCIILMTLSTAMSYADTALQIWYVWAWGTLKKEFCPWVWDGAGLGFPAGALVDELRVVGQTLLPAQTVPGEMHHPHGLGSALTPFGSGYNKDVSGRGCVREQLLWRASCAQRLGLIGTSTSEGVWRVRRHFPWQGCLSWLPGGQRHINPNWG